MIFFKTHFTDTTKALDFINIIFEIRQGVREANAESGHVIVSVPYPGAALVVFEKAGMADKELAMKKALEGFMQNHLLQCFLPKSLVLPLEKGKMMMEPWQEVFLIDYESAARRREFRVQVFSEEKPKEANGPPQR